MLLSKEKKFFKKMLEREEVERRMRETFSETLGKNRSGIVF